jgi:hypothetical protein
MTAPGYSVPPTYSPDEKAHRRQLGEGVQNLFQGKMNATSSITLNASATTTTITDSRIGATTHISLSPTTPDAATALATTYVSSQKNGSAVLTHANSTSIDRTFSLLFIG